MSSSKLTFVIFCQRGSGRNHQPDRASPSGLDYTPAMAPDVETGKLKDLADLSWENSLEVCLFPLRGYHDDEGMTKHHGLPVDIPGQDSSNGNRLNHDFETEIKAETTSKH